MTGAPTPSCAILTGRLKNSGHIDSKRDRLDRVGVAEGPSIVEDKLILTLLSGLEAKHIDTAPTRHNRNFMV